MSWLDLVTSLLCFGVLSAPVLTCRLAVQAASMEYGGQHFTYGYSALLGMGLGGRSSKHSALRLL